MKNKVIVMSLLGFLSTGLVMSTAQADAVPSSFDCAGHFQMNNDQGQLAALPNNVNAAANVLTVMAIDGNAVKITEISSAAEGQRQILMQRSLTLVSGVASDGRVVYRSTNGELAFAVDFANPVVSTPGNVPQFREVTYPATLSAEGLRNSQNQVEPSLSGDSFECSPAGSIAGH